MQKEKKGQRIDEIQAEIARCSIGILTDYRGLKTQEIDALRRKLQDAGGDYKVVKNTLAQKALERLNRQELRDSFTGPVAIAFGYQDATTLAKAFADYVRTTRIAVTVTSGFLPSQSLTAEDINTLATLPSREILIGRVIGGIKSPLYGLAGVLAAPLRNLQWVLQSRVKQLEGTN